MFVAVCGQKHAAKPVKVTSSTALTLNTLNGKKLDMTKSYKVYVQAYRNVKGKKVYLSKSKELHVSASKNRFTNAAKIAVRQSAVTLRVGKTSQIKTTVTKDDAKKPIQNHASNRYWTDNAKVATVDNNGKITAKGKGTTKVYVMAPNGVKTSVKVTVK